MGVWIETIHSLHWSNVPTVTPCVGVWIETSVNDRIDFLLNVTPCVGVWIETYTEPQSKYLVHVTPCVGVWIETVARIERAERSESHPAWVCGLKHRLVRPSTSGSRHTLRGCVD